MSTTQRPRKATSYHVRMAEVTFLLIKKCRSVPELIEDCGMKPGGSSETVIKRIVNALVDEGLVEFKGYRDRNGDRGRRQVIYGWIWPEAIDKEIK
jgi:predicted transcriptional regulator